MKNAFKAVLFMLVLMLSASFAAAVGPDISNIPDQTVSEGSLLKVAVTSISTVPDPAGTPTFAFCRIIPGAPDSCTLVPATATAPAQVTIGATKANLSNLSTLAEFNWTPDFTQAGTYRFNVSVSDADSATSDIFTVTVNDVPPRLTVASVLTLGGDTQERSNPNHDTESKRELNVSGTITVTNSGEAVSGLTGTASIASGFAASDLLVNFTLPKTSLATGESISVPVSIRVPQKLDAVTNALVPAAVNVASIAFSATPATGGTVSATTRLDLKAENDLEIKDVKVRFDGKSESVDDGDTVNDMKPGMNVEFEIELENRFKDKEDVTIEDIEVKVVGNGQLDIDEDQDVGDLGPEDKDTVTLSSVIDDDADDGTFDVEISAEGTDEFGARHGGKMTIRFEIKRKSHEIEIQSLVLNPPTVSCEKETSLSVNIKNSGRRDEEEVFVNVASPELKFGARSDQLSIDKDDEETVNFNMPVSESTPRPANYRVTVDTFYNTGTKSNSDVVLLSVAKCGAEEEQPPAEEEQPPAEEEKPPVVVVTPPPQANITPPVQVVQPPAKKSFLETPQYIALLGLGYLVVLGVGAAVLIKLMKPQ